MKRFQARRQSQKGFTLIELVMVIVILGILAAVALPKFVDLSDQAGLAATQGVAGAIASGSAANFAARKVGNTSAVTINQANVCDALVVGTVLQGGLPTGFNITAGASGSNASCAATADTATCTIASEKAPTQTAQATIYCAR